MELFGIQVTREQLAEWAATAQQYALPRLLQSVGQLALGAALYVTARWVLARVERRFTARTKSLVDDHVIEVVRRSVSFSVIAWVAWRVAYIWDLPGLATFVVAVWIVALSLPIADFVAKLLRVFEEQVVPRTETTLDDTALPLLNKVVRFLVVAGGAIMALSHLGTNILPVLAGASVAGVAIGFAAKDTLSNLIAGVLLIIDRPFKVGDRVELWSAPENTAQWGDVIEIGLRATKIRNPDNLIFVIPNNEIMRRDIVNYTASGDHIRLRIPIAIAYDADPQRAKEIILKVASATNGVMPDPESQVIIRSFGESAVDLELRVWIANARQRRAIGDEITDRVKSEFDRCGIEIPYAKRDLYIRAMPETTPDAAPRLPPGGEND